MSSTPFKQVDVFTRKPFKGNPVAVVMEAQGLSTEQMQAIANWTNLSETTFVLPEDNSNADYRVRIFTPDSELPFAGHPTVGTAHALLESGSIVPQDGRLIQECGVGLVELQVTPEPAGGNTITFVLPEPQITLLSSNQADTLEKLLGCPVNRTAMPALIDVGAKWIVAQTTDAQTVLAANPDYAGLQAHDLEFGITGVSVFGEYGPGDHADIEVRSFAPACGVNEDPVCGSGNGSVAAFMRYHRINLTSDQTIISSQGKMRGRDGELVLSRTNGRIFVGGSAITCISGSITI